jgi:hypothetical protein
MRLLVACTNAGEQSAQSSLDSETNGCCCCNYCSRMFTADVGYELSVKGTQYFRS